jgi:hypothetical protein
MHARLLPTSATDKPRLQPLTLAILISILS